MSSYHLVLEDPTQEYWTGALVDDLRDWQLQSRGVITIPVVPDLFRKSGVGGFHQRFYGSGWDLNSSAPKMFSPMTMFCVQDLQVLNWRAKLIMDESFQHKEDTVLQGFILPASDTSQVNNNRLGIGVPNAIQMRDLPLAELKQGLVIGGKA